jgi:hypothetical protein
MFHLTTIQLRRCANTSNSRGFDSPLREHQLACELLFLPFFWHLSGSRTPPFLGSENGVESSFLPFVHGWLAYKADYSPKVLGRIRSH